ncbi:unnamed protein product [Arctogadus glacialis]
MHLALAQTVLVRLKEVKHERRHISCPSNPTPTAAQVHRHGVHQGLAFSPDARLTPSIVLPPRSPTGPLTEGHLTEGHLTGSPDRGGVT